MKHCDSCNASYSDEFRFCPADGMALRSAAECENQRRVSVSAGYVGRSTVHLRKWLFAVFAIAIAVGVLLVFTSLRAVQSPDQADPQPVVVDKSETRTKPIVKQRSVSPRRATHARAAAEPDESRDAAEPDQSRDAADDLVQQARAQQLVATGYRYLQQRDYESARDAFEEALEIDPHSIAAQKGLNAAQTAESVEGVVGVFRR